MNLIQQRKAEEEAARTENDILDRKNNIESIEQSIRENASREGELKSSRNMYDFQETRFNKRYKENLARNIMGSYEPGTLEIKGRTYKLELTEDASQVLEQLSTILQSHEDLMKKLAVDLSFVEREKENIVDLMSQYIQEVHSHLGKIDGNSTITVRGRTLKMLRIQLPEWEENAEIYHIRLNDMVDEIVRKGVAIFEQNENAQEYFGTQITTKNLYDFVVGISNVQIKLYKIEAQREYPITWAEVAKNSGGEGFLSAFVILSSLLYYMRKDDTDFFSDWNEGKVLVMDNPFAQTNASHLLKPIMDMARKENTQLICLTGLGGESIYNRFDNIYVMNLVAASLRKGMQYLKAAHVKGSEPETMIVSQVKVVEQTELEI